MTSPAATNLAPRGNVTNGVDQILSMPRASVYRAAAGGVATGTPSAITWDTVEYDTDGMWRAATPTALFAVTAGTYACTSWAEFANAGDATYRQFYFRKNGANAFGQVTGVSINGLQWAVCSTIQIQMSAGDFVQPIFAHGSATTPLTFTAATAAFRLNGFTACLIST